MELVDFPIGHACTKLTMTLDHLTAAFSIARSSGASKSQHGRLYPRYTAHDASIHDFNLFKSLLDYIKQLAQSRLLGINSNKKCLVDALPREAIRHLANSAAILDPILAARRHGAAAHTHMM